MNHPTVDVVNVAVVGNHRVSLTFSDGCRVERDLAPILWGPVFQEIRSSEEAFSRVAVDPELGVIAWPNGADIDAELLRYDDLWDEALRLTQPV